MKIKTYIVDAFTNEPFKGNPAGVCMLENAIAAETMQSIATEINLSETAFLLPNKKDDTKYTIRYFTPTVEIAFCGHATLAASKLILHQLKKEKVSFTTPKNLQLNALSDGQQIKMKFPLYNTIAYQPQLELYSALGITDPINTQFSTDLDMLIIEVKNKQTLQKITPDFAKMLRSSDRLKEVVVTAKSDDKPYDFYSRCFCPWIGIDEDPVTGASHTVLAGYWGAILGKQEMVAYQLSKRGGFMKLSVKSKTELEVTSEAVIVFEGIINIAE